MYIDYSSWETFEYSLNTLQLDLNNPRIKYSGMALNQTQIMKFLIQYEKIYDLAKKISEEGYFVGEEPIICIENEKKVVLEGNRRTAALKLLREPEKYLSTSKANILIQNIAKNNFPVEKKLKCYIAPNRLLANPIIYERHNGSTLERWKTGNQYAFVAEMYYEDGLSIEDICDVLNEKRSKILKPLKAYNLFYEGKEVLEKKGISLDVGKFEFTNLERFYNYAPARELIGIEFENETGELIISLPKEEFEKRLAVIFTSLVDAERFSRDFNKEEDKHNYIEKMKNNSEFDFSVSSEGKKKGKTSEKKTDLEKEKEKTTTRRRKRSSKKKGYYDKAIPASKEIIFDNEKLDSLFVELKSLPIDKKYSFALLLRTYLEQSLYFYLEKRELFDDLDLKTNEKAQKNSRKKVETLTNYLRNKYSITETIEEDEIMNILKYNQKKDYSNASLKIMLDYVKNNELDEHLDAAKLKNIKDYIERIKSGLDLAVHNLNTIVDSEHNKRAWLHLEPLFDILSENLLQEEN